MSRRKDDVFDKKEQMGDKSSPLSEQDHLGGSGKQGYADRAELDWEEIDRTRESIFEWLDKKVVKYMDSPDAIQEYVDLMKFAHANPFHGLTKHEKLSEDFQELQIKIRAAQVAVRKAYQEHTKNRGTMTYNEHREKNLQTQIDYIEALAKHVTPIVSAVCAKPESEFRHKAKK